MNKIGSLRLVGDAQQDAEFDVMKNAGRNSHLRPLVHVAICVPTTGGACLRQCLESLDALALPLEVYCRLIIASNGDKALMKTANIAERFRSRGRFPCVHIHDDEPNIAKARNAAMQRAVDMGADQILFIDDDEIAAPNWLHQLLEPTFLHVPVLAGVNRTMPHSGSFWAPPAREIPLEGHGERLKTASSGNVRISAELYKRGFRFDERLALTGGEDTDYFARLARCGVEIRRTNYAVTHEPLPAWRCTYRAQVYRAYWIAACGVHLDRRVSGAWRALLRNAPAIAGELALGLVLLAAAPIAGLTAVRRFKFAAMKGGRKLGKAAGRLVALVGHRPQPYRHR